MSIFHVHRPSGEVMYVEAKNWPDAIVLSGWTDGCVIYREQFFVGDDQDPFLKGYFLSDGKMRMLQCSLRHGTEKQCSQWLLASVADHFSKEATA